MIKKKEFIELIEDRIDQQKRIEKLCDILELPIWSSNIFYYQNILFDQLINIYFTEEGVDWIKWYIFEKYYHPDLEAYDENDKEITVETIEDLWKLIKQYRKC